MRVATTRRMKGMHTPLRVTVLACSFIPASCGALPASERSAPANGAFTAAEVPGTWSLTDDENVTFDVVLSAEGSAVSNWSKGPQGAKGEEGRWALKDGCIEIDYTDGWHDAIIRDHRGWLVKQSYAPGASRSGPPTNHGQAVRTPEALARWVGLYETQSQESAGKQTFRIAIQSSHVAWKTIGTPKMGSWWAVGDRLHIRWADGWIDELHADGNAWASRTWQAGTALDATGTPVGAPTFQGRGRKVK